MRSVAGAAVGAAGPGKEADGPAEGARKRTGRRRVRSCCRTGRTAGRLLLACAALCGLECGSSESGGGVWKAGGSAAEALRHRPATKLATLRGMGDGVAQDRHGQRDPDHRVDMRAVSAGLETHQVSGAGLRARDAGGARSRVCVVAQTRCAGADLCEPLPREG